MPATIFEGNTTMATPTALAWGNKVSPAFRSLLYVGCRNLGIDPNWLMACMAWESGETFSPSKLNMAGSGAVGLIQFMPSTARSLGTSTAALAAMTPEEQLKWVFKYFAPREGKLHTLSDVYMAILWPRAVGKLESYALFDRSVKPLALYRQNAGIDINKDGICTKAEAAAKVNAKLVKGMQAPYVWRAAGTKGSTP